MKILALDSSAVSASACILEDGNILAEDYVNIRQTHSQTLMVMVQHVLEITGTCLSDVDVLAVSAGPGSFTGVRAGLAFARGLALGSPDLKLTGVSAFEVYANMLKESDRAFYNAVVIETKREDFYFQLFDENLKKISEPLALTREEIANRLKSRQTSFIGDGAERLLSVSMGLQIKQVEITDMMSTEALFRTTYQKYLQKNLDFPKPLYIRAADTSVRQAGA